MAAVEDDKGFGDFMFASSSVIPNNFSNDNDDWSDFISHSQISKPIEPLGFFSSYGEKSMLAQIESVRSEIHLVKPRGALPLSMFGEADENEDLDPSLGGEESLFTYKHGDSVKNRSNLNPVVGINDLIANLYSQSHEIKLVNENVVDLSSNTKEVNLNGQNSDRNYINSDLNDNFDDDDDGWEFKGADSEAPVGDEKAESDICKADSGLNSNFTQSNLSWNGFNSNSSELHSSFFGPVLVENGSNSITANGSRDIDDDNDGWDCKGVESDSWVRDENTKVDRKGQGNAVGTEYVYQFDKARRDPTDWFVSSDGNAQKSYILDLTFNFNPSYVTRDRIISDSECKSKQNNTANDLSSSPAALNLDSDEIFWEFKDAVEGTKPNYKVEEQINADVSPAGVEVLACSDDDAHGPNNSSAVSDGTSHNSGQRDFGFSFNSSCVTEDGVYLESESKIKEYEMANGLSSPQNVSTYMPTTSTLTNTFRSRGSNTSIHDLISSLYGQADQNSTVNNTPKAGQDSVISFKTEMDSDSVSGGDNFDDDSCDFQDALSGTRGGDQTSSNHTPVQTVLDSNIVNTNSFDDDLWDFKDAISGARDEDQASALDLKDSFITFSTKSGQNNYVNFYRMLNDELCFITQSHLDDLKKARRLAAVSGADTKIKALDQEIQEFYNELSVDVTTSKEFHMKNGWQRNTALNGLLEVLQEPLFQVFESEYDLARRLSLAEKDSRSAIELLKHVASTLKILTMGSMEDQCNYVSTWYKMLSICAQELKYGASIWGQALQKNVRNQLLSEPQGQRYITALGEIYRVIEVLGASAKLYQPWILSSADPRGIFYLLNECYNLWLSSGLAEALQIISDPIGLDYDGMIKALLESIKHIHDLDALALQNHFLDRQEPTCCLSVLTPETLPGMEMVEWKGEHYFLTLANLWANLVSRDPPKLLHREIGR